MSEQHQSSHTHLTKLSGHRRKIGVSLANLGGDRDHDEFTDLSNKITHSSFDVVRRFLRIKHSLLQVELQSICAG